MVVIREIRKVGAARARNLFTLGYQNVKTLDSAHIQDRLTKEYPDLEFKVFQIKKQREDRNLQDASVYTYLLDGSSRYCIEYNVKTNLESGSTVLEYILTADDEVLQGRACQELIQQNQMEKVGSSYRKVFEFDYSKDCSDDPITHMFYTIKTYVNKALGR